jgi:hypothetical protein
VIEILKARRYVTGQIDAEAWLDNSRVTPEGDPDPAYLLRHSWYINPDEWAARTPAQRDAWTQSMRLEFAEMCRSQLEIVNDAQAGGTVLPIEGQTFPP